MVLYSWLLWIRGGYMQYNTKEFAERINVAPTTLYKWEKDFKLTVPRHANGNRYYTENEALIFNKIKNLRYNKYSIESIKQYLNRDIDKMHQEEIAVTNMPIQYLTQNEIQEIMQDNIQLVRDQLATTLQSELSIFKKQLKKDIKNELNFEFYKQQKQLRINNKKIANLIEYKFKEAKSKSIKSKILGIWRKGL